MLAGTKNTKNPADRYFNSLRELGGARRILEEEDQNTIKAYGDRKRIGEERGLRRRFTAKRALKEGRDGRRLLEFSQCHDSPLPAESVRLHHGTQGRSLPRGSGA